MTGLSERDQVMGLVSEAMTAGARQDRACAAICLSARTMQRWQCDVVRSDQRPLRVQAPQNKLSTLERQRLLAIANSAEFRHLPPSQIVPRLADRGQYVASESTFNRILKAEHQLRHRGVALGQPPERPGQPRSKPRALSASAPNELFSWDITYLPTSVNGRYFQWLAQGHLYLFMDVFSRKVVGWQVYGVAQGHETESSDLASEVMRDLCKRENIAPDQVVLHSDNGSPMALGHPVKGATMALGHPVLATLQSLGVIPSFSRPAVSNDNPFSESLFRTMKYRPTYPRRPFESLLAARQWVGTFVQWYNHEHRHSAIGFVTPDQRHTGPDSALLNQRVQVYQAAKARHPQRWSGPRPASGATRNWQPISIVYLNPDQLHTDNNRHKDNHQTLKQAA